MHQGQQYRRSTVPPSMPLFHLQKRAPWPPPPTDVVGKAVPPVAGAATGNAADAVLADDVGASATPFDDTARKTLVSVTASRRCCCSKSHCRRRRLLRSLRQGQHRHLHIFRLKPLLNSPAITAEKLFRKGAISVLPVTSDRGDSP